MKQLLIGADPELFVSKGSDYVSAHGLIPGTKAQPHKVEEGAVQVDGMALEFNIDPCPNADFFVNRVNRVLETLRSMVPQDLDLVISPVAMFNKEYFDSLPKEAKELGCDPDFNAYTKDLNDTPSGQVSMRTAAGHVHMGWTQDADPYDPEHFDLCCEIVKELDYTLGIPSVYYDGNEESSVRRKMYGRAGSFRPKPYGLEYRVLSNFWLMGNDYMRMIFNSTRWTFEQMSKKKESHTRLSEMYRKAHHLPEGDETFDIQRIINECDKRIAGLMLGDINFWRPN